MGLKVLLHRRARAELESIRDYLVENAGNAVAEKVRLHLRQRIEMLGDFPAAGLASTEPGIRVLSPTKYPYRIYITVSETAVIILHIRHTSRRAPTPDEITRR